jgi:hypothetical protein
MTTQQGEPALIRRQPEPDFTQDPDEPAALRLIALPPIYTEDYRKEHRASAVTLAPCQTCGVAIITGQLATGALVTVEPQTCTYALLWASGETYPRLTPSRSYPAHQCRPTTRHG